MILIYKSSNKDTFISLKEVYKNFKLDVCYAKSSKRDKRHNNYRYFVKWFKQTEPYKFNYKARHNDKYNCLVCYQLKIKKGF